MPVFVTRSRLEYPVKMAGYVQRATPISAAAMRLVESFASRCRGFTPTAMGCRRFSA